MFPNEVSINMVLSFFKAYMKNLRKKIEIKSK